MAKERRAERRCRSLSYDFRLVKAAREQPLVVKRHGHDSVNITIEFRSEHCAQTKRCCSAMTELQREHCGSQGSGVCAQGDNRRAASASGTRHETCRFQEIAALVTHMRAVAPAQRAADRHHDVENRLTIVSRNSKHRISSRRALAASSCKGEREHTVKMPQR